MSARYVRARYASVGEMPGVLDRARAHPERTSSTRGPEPDALLLELLELQGFLGLPQVASRAAIDRHVHAGELELWRGVPSFEYARELTFSATPFVGPEGIYTGLGRRGFQHALAKRDGRDGCVLRLTLRGTAQVLAAAALRDGVAGDPPRDYAQRLVLRGYARWAAARGVDAYGWPGGPDFMLVLNRTALRVQDVAYVPLWRSDGSATMQPVTLQNGSPLARPQAAAALAPIPPGPLRPLGGCTTLAEAAKAVAKYEARVSRLDEAADRLRREISALERRREALLALSASGSP